MIHENSAKIFCNKCNFENFRMKNVFFWQQAFVRTKENFFDIKFGRCSKGNNFQSRNSTCYFLFGLISIEQRIFKMLIYCFPFCVRWYSSQWQETAEQNLVLFIYTDFRYSQTEAHCGSFSTCNDFSKKIKKIKSKINSKLIMTATL